MTPAAELRIPADPAFVGLARLVVARAARQAGVTQDRVQDVKIAVAEALANAVQAQSALDVPASVDLSFGATDQGFEVVVRAPGTPVMSDAPHALEAGLFDPSLSFTLIEGLTDKMSYESDGAVMCLRFVVGVGRQD
jgi:anti-sigma regulatory factor (Ser/Thr protein kinase)